MAEKTDEVLIKNALQGDQRAYKKLLERHRHAIFHIAYKIVRNTEEAADLVQETFMKAFGSLSTYRFEYRFSTWSARLRIRSSRITPTPRPLHRGLRTTVFPESRRSDANPWALSMFSVTRVLG